MHPISYHECVSHLRVFQCNGFDPSGAVNNHQLLFCPLSLSAHIIMVGVFPTIIIRPYHHGGCFSHYHYPLILSWWVLCSLQLSAHIIMVGVFPTIIIRPYHYGGCFSHHHYPHISSWWVFFPLSLSAHIMVGVLLTSIIHPHHGGCFAHCHYPPTSSWWVFSISDNNCKKVDVMWPSSLL